MPYLSIDSKGEVMLAVHVQPKASRNSVSGIHDNCLKIAVTSPPVDGKANKAIIQFLSKLLKIPKKDILLKSGQSSRRKLFHISGSSLEVVRGYIESVLEK